MSGQNSTISTLDAHTMLRRLHRSLKKGIKGLTSLHSVYANDPVILAHLESLAERSHIIDREIDRYMDTLRTKVGDEAISTDSE